MDRDSSLVDPTPDDIELIEAFSDSNLKILEIVPQACEEENGDDITVPGNAQFTTTVEDGEEKVARLRKSKRIPSKLKQKVDKVLAQSPVQDCEEVGVRLTPPSRPQCKYIPDHAAASITDSIRINFKLKSVCVKLKKCRIMGLDRPSHFTEQSAVISSRKKKKRKKLFKCKICTIAFYSKHELKRHLVVHTGEKPFICSVCQKSFARKCNLKVHKIGHNGEKAYKCGVCQQGFSRHFTLKEHMRVHSGAKPFKCRVCETEFSFKVNLKRHMMIHFGEKPYTCAVCKKSFREKAHLKFHMKVHTDDPVMEEQNSVDQPKESDTLYIEEEQSSDTDKSEEGCIIHDVDMNEENIAKDNEVFCIIHDFDLKEENTERDCIDDPLMDKAMEENLCLTPSEEQNSVDEPKEDEPVMPVLYKSLDLSPSKNHNSEDPPKELDESIGIYLEDLVIDLPEDVVLSSENPPRINSAFLLH